MATIEVIGGDLWEYDVDRTLSVTGFEEGDLLDVAREPACVAVTVPIADDGTAPVPNQLLGRYGGRLLVLIRRDNQVVYRTWFKVNGRKRPEDYGYVTTPTVGYQSLRQEMLDRFEELEDDVATAGLVKGVEAPLSLSEAGILSVDVPFASATVAGKASFGTDFDVSPEGAVSLYRAIALTGLSGGSANEVGSTVDSVTLSWDWNKAPDKLQLDGADVAKGEDGQFPKSLELTKQAITKDRTYTLVATDARGAKSTKTTSVTFQLKAYWGVGAADATVDSAFLLALAGSALTSSKVRDFTVDAGAGQLIYYAIPSSLGTPTFFVGGFEGGFAKAATFEHVNASGGRASYDVYKSTNAGLGQTTVNAK